MSAALARPTIARRRTTVRLATAVTLALLVPMLASCGEAAERSGEAGRVGASVLTVEEVTERSEEVLAVSASVEGAPIDTAELNSAQVSNWIQERLVDIVSDEEGVEVSQGDVDRFLDEVITTNGTTRAEFERAVALQAGFWIPPSGLEAYAQSFLQQQEIGRVLAPEGSEEEQQLALVAAITETGEAVGVEVSPRYGVWDPTTGRVAPSVNDLSSPAPAAEPDEGLVPAPPGQG